MNVVEVIPELLYWLTSLVGGLRKSIRVTPSICTLVMSLVESDFVDYFGVIRAAMELPIDPDVAMPLRIVKFFKGEIKKQI